ncbi:hypothetical protein CY35_09G095300 [Sphagnum magellanicum]|nr:hypothetical protein CY35_09G095300 [Sphagnum magellanicum]
MYEEEPSSVVEGNESCWSFNRLLLRRRSSQALGFCGFFWFLMASKPRRLLERILYVMLQRSEILGVDDDSKPPADETLMKKKCRGIVFYPIIV